MLTVVTTPEWLAKHGGELKANRDGQSWAVYVGGEPQYLVMPVPAEGKFACRVSQTNNGKRLDGPTVHDTLEDALKGGLEDLRKVLGW
jgi:hypothetical protein